MAFGHENVGVKQRSASLEHGHGRTLSSMDTFEKYLFLFKIPRLKERDEKACENFNRRNTSSILRIKI